MSHFFDQKVMTKPQTSKKELVTAFRTREILAAARSLLAQRGLEALTMDDIAQAARVAKGTLYLYFPSKDELIQALLSEVGEALIREVEIIMALPQEAPEKLRELVKLFLRHLEQDRGLFPAYLRELVRFRSGRVTSLTPKLKELEERMIGLLSRLFAEGMAEGRFIEADPRLLAYLLKGLIRGVGHLQMTEASGKVVGMALPVVLQLLFSGLVLPPNPQKVR
jgi:AcrR family transcriptional regulator